MHSCTNFAVVVLFHASAHQNRQHVGSISRSTAAVATSVIEIPA